MNTIVLKNFHAGYVPGSRLSLVLDTLRLRGEGSKMTKKERKESLADYVRRILKVKDLTFKDVERLSENGVTAGTVNKIVNYGLENLTAKTIESLAKGLGESPDSIFHLILGSSPKTTDSELAALFYNYGELSEDDKNELKLLLEVVDNEIERRRSKKK